MDEKIVIKPIKSEENLGLRSQILRNGDTSREKNVFPDDQEPTTLHIGAFIDEKLVGIASIYQREENSWQLRGMAVVENFRRFGIGRKIIEFAIFHIKNQAGKTIWCNARTSAIDFYSSLGFKSIGDEFDVPEVGPHFVMEKFL